VSGRQKGRRPNDYRPLRQLPNRARQCRC
jgi:hypothetical protein